jgi:hypothetical protein
MMLALLALALASATGPEARPPSNAPAATAGTEAAPHYALLNPAFGRGKREQPAAKATIRRARAALTRAPLPLRHMHTEGTLPGQGIREISLVAQRDAAITLDLALAWRLTGERAFLDQAGRYLDAWARIYQISLNPIDETRFDMMMMATDLTRADLPAEMETRIDGLWRHMASGYLDAMEAGAKNGITNWQSHRIKLATMAAFQAGDRALIDRARAAYRKQIEANLRPDGSTFDYEERDALHYVTYNLDPLMMAALSAKLHGEDWFHWSAPNGASLPRSLDWLAAFASGARTHIEFAHSKIQFDRDRAGAGQSEYAPHAWKPANAINTFAIASLLDPRFGALSTTLQARNHRAPTDWIALF